MEKNKAEKVKLFLSYTNTVLLLIIAALLATLVYLIYPTIPIFD